MKIFRTYSELCQLTTFEERFDYLKIGGTVGEETFGFNRYLNQRLYRSKEWKRVRFEVIIRDDGRDMGVSDRAIVGKPIIHHMNPITIEDILDGNPDIFNPEYLILVSEETHNAIHYGDKSLLPKLITERYAGDTKLW